MSMVELNVTRIEGNRKGVRGVQELGGSRLRLLLSSLHLFDVKRAIPYGYREE